MIGRGDAVRRPATDDDPPAVTLPSLSTIELAIESRANIVDPPRAVHNWLDGSPPLFTSRSLRSNSGNWQVLAQGFVKNLLFSHKAS